jgi:hypothetical protein
MKSKRFVALSAVFLLVLLASASALAMSSLNYHLDWFVPLSGGGGGQSSSSSYTANFTVGQVAAGASSSASYQAGLGYWYGVEGQYKLFLSTVQKGN